MLPALKLRRRHVPGCHLQHKYEVDCSCPVWCEGRINGRRVRHSMNTTSWDRAVRKLAHEYGGDGEDLARNVTVAEAIASYLADCRARKLSQGTLTSYANTLEQFRDFTQREHYATIENVTLESLGDFRVSRLGKTGEAATASTLRKEIGQLRAFCAFCVDRRWMLNNLAKKLRPPKEGAPATLPFEPDEVARIVAACARLGGRRKDRRLKAARRRARALVLLLLYSGLRISDVAALSRERLDAETGHLFVRQMKSGAALSVKLPLELVSELLSLPSEGRYIFTRGSLKSTVRSIRRTLDRVFAIAKLKAHPHCFRDTFAVRLLEEDVPIRTVSLLLGHTSVRTTEKHYGVYVQSQQRLLDAATAKLDRSSLSELPQFPLKDRRRDPKRNVAARRRSA